jgi:hypothetical protein
MEQNAPWRKVNKPEEASDPEYDPVIDAVGHVAIACAQLELAAKELCNNLCMHNSTKMMNQNGLTLQQYVKELDILWNDRPEKLIIAPEEEVRIPALIREISKIGDQRNEILHSILVSDDSDESVVYFMRGKRKSVSGALRIEYDRTALLGLAKSARRTALDVVIAGGNVGGIFQAEPLSKRQRWPYSDQSFRPYEEPW